VGALTWENGAELRKEVWPGVPWQTPDRWKMYTYLYLLTLKPLQRTAERDTVLLLRVAGNLWSVSTAPHEERKQIGANCLSEVELPGTRKTSYTTVLERFYYLLSLRAYRTFFIYFLSPRAYSAAFPTLRVAMGWVSYDPGEAKRGTYPTTRS